MSPSKSRDIIYGGDGSGDFVDWNDLARMEENNQLKKDNKKLKREIKKLEARIKKLNKYDREDIIDLDE